MKCCMCITTHDRSPFLIVSQSFIESLLNQPKAWHYARLSASSAFMRVCVMRYKEYGTGNQDTMIFLHGGGLSWWNYREEAQKLQDRYHIIIPVLDGHSGSDRQFISIEENAREIIRYVDASFGGKVLLMGGLSLGGQILLEILSERSDICRYALIESAMVIPSPCTRLMIAPVFGAAYGLIRHRWFAELQFRSLHIKPELFEDYYRDTCAIKKEDMISFLQANTAYALKKTIRDCTANVHIYIGEKETGGIRKSAEEIRKIISGGEVKELKGMYHGEFSINHAEDYVNEMERILNH